jgi:hypothetical protein
MKFDAGYAPIPRRIWTLLEGTPPAWAKVWLYVFMSSNIRPGTFRGRTVGPGQLVRAIGTISAECGVSPSQTRSALNHMRDANVIAIETTNNFSVITLLDWECYGVFTSDKSQTESQAISQAPSQTNRKRDRNDLDNREKTIEEDEERGRVSGASIPPPPPPPCGKTPASGAPEFTDHSNGEVSAEHPHEGGPANTVAPSVEIVSTANALVAMEESAREADSPPLLVPDEPPTGKTSPVEARKYITANICQYLDKYPKRGGRPLTVDKAVIAYGEDPDSGPVEAWWAEVLASLEVFLDLYRRGRLKRIPDPPFWFEDRWHRQDRPALTQPEPPPPPPLYQPEEPADASPLIELQQTERTIALVPFPHGPRSAPRPCGRCKGLGDLPGPVPPLNLAMTPEEIAMLTESARIPCPQCHPAMAATA